MGLLLPLRTGEALSVTLLGMTGFPGVLYRRYLPSSCLNIPSRSPVLSPPLYFFSKVSKDTIRSNQINLHVTFKRTSGPHTSTIQFHKKKTILDQGSTNIFCKGPDSIYFTPINHMAPVTTTQICFYTAMAST